jgi:hypothetical protein
MRDQKDDRTEAIPLWRARACRHGRGGTEAAYGFGGHEVAEAIGTPDQIGKELACFLDSLGRGNVEAEGARTGRLVIELEIAPSAGGTSTLTGMGREPPTKDPVPLWAGTAAVGNGHGIFDACYSFGSFTGEEGRLLGTAQELGDELARVLTLLTRGDVEAMKYDTDRFFLQLVVEQPQAGE